MDKIAHEVRTQEWFSIIQTCNTSGQPKRQWCEEHGISVRKFFYWQKKIREDLYKEAKKRAASQDPAAPVGSMELVSAFAEIQTTTVAETQGKQFQPDAIIKAGGVSIQLSNAATRELLNRISGVLSHAV